MEQIHIEQNGMDYQNGNIYQILNGETNDVYVGSTCSSLSKRWHEHRISINKPGRLYEMMKEIGTSGAINYGFLFLIAARGKKT